MSDKEKMQAETPTVKPEAGPSTAQGTAKPVLHEMHGRYLDMYRQTLAVEGEAVFSRWGLSLFHSLSDEEAETQRRALGFEPFDALDFYNRGCLLAREEKYEEAVAAFAEAFKRDAELAEALFNQALAQESSGKLAAARKHYQQYVEQFPDREDVAEVNQHLGTLADS